MNIVVALAVWSLTAINVLLMVLQFKYAFLIIGVGDVVVSVLVLIYFITAALHTVSQQL